MIAVTAGLANRGTALSWWQQRAILGLLIAIHGFLAVAVCPLGTDPRIGWLFLPWVGTISSQACLLAAWAALRPGPTRIRLPLPLLLVVCAGLAVNWGLRRNLPSGIGAAHDFAHALIPVVGFAVMLPAFWLPRRLLGWRIVGAPQRDHSKLGTWQFSTRHLFAWVTGIAITMGSYAFLFPNAFTEKADIGMSGTLLLAAVIAVSTLPAIPCIAFLLSTHHRWRYGAALLAGFTTLAAMLYASAFTVFIFAPQSLLANFLAVQAGFYTSFVVTTLTMRAADFRLVRTSTVRNSTADAAEPRTHPTPAIRFASLVVLCGIILAGLMWPAVNVIPNRRRQSLAMQWFWEVRATITPKDGPPTEVFYLADKPLTDRRLQKLFDTSGITSVRFSNTSITDAQLGRVKTLGDIESLMLDGTPITDDGLKHLESLKNLRWLDLTGTRATATGVDRLQQALPNCEIVLPSTAVQEELLANEAVE